MSLNIDGILEAQGLEPAERATLSALINVSDRVQARNATLVRYYNGDVQPADIGISTFPDNVRIEEHCDWPRKAVTSVAERSRLSGFVFSGGSEDDDLNRVVLDNDLIAAYQRNVHSELIHGCMFATVGLNDAGECYVRFHTAESAAAIWNDRAGRIECGFVIADMTRTDWSPNSEVPVRVNLHLPGKIVSIARDTHTASSWMATYNDTPLDRPAMEAFCYRPTGLKPFGETRISKTVRSITDDVIRTLQNMAVSSAFYSSPQKFLLGLSDEQYDMMMGSDPDDDDHSEEAEAKRALKSQVSRWNTYITNLLIATRDEDGNVPEFGQLTAASPEPYIAVLRTYATMFSGATGVPLNSLGVVQDNPSSAEAIEAAREDICLCAQDLNLSNATSLRNVALMAMAVKSDVGIDGLTDVQRTVTAKFLNPSMPSIVSQADAATKIAAVATDFVSSDEFWRMLGLDEATVAEMRNVRALSSANALLNAFATNGAQAQTAGA